MTIAAKPREQYLLEIQELAARFEELEVAFRPQPGEVDTMIVPVSVLRNLMAFCETGLLRLQKVADFLSDEALAVVLAAGDRRDDAGVCRDVIDVNELSEWFLP